MAPIFSFLLSSRSKKEESRYECLSEARASHSHKKWTEVSSSVPHFLQMGVLLSPITHKCRLRVLWPVRRPMTTLDCVLIKDNNPALVAKSGLEFNFRACLCVLQGPDPHYQMLVVHPLSHFLCSALRPPRKALVSQNWEHCRPLRAFRRFNFLAVPLKAWSGPEGSRKWRFPDFMSWQDGGKVASLTHRQPLPPGNISGTHFCWRLSRRKDLMAMKNSNDTSWDRTSDFPICSTAP